MRLISVFIVVFVMNSSFAYACSCAFTLDESISSKVKRYEFIALVKIKQVRVYSFKLDSTSTQNDFAQIEIIEIFKGNKVDSIHIWGIGSSCDMGVKSGEEWLIYGNKYNNNYTTNNCTPSTEHSSQNWRMNLPFFLTDLYSLQTYFNHPLPDLKNGVNETFFSNKQLKSRYTVINNNIEGDFYYLSDNDGSGKAYNCHFKNGKLHGNSFTIGIEHKWINVLKYNNGELTEKIEYSIKDSIGIGFTLSDRQKIDFSIKRQKAFQYHQLFLPDKSVLTKSYYKNNSINRIEHKDSTGNLLFTFQYSEDGKLSGQQVLDVNSGISTYIGYYPSGVMERKIIRRSDRTQTSYFYNSDGSLKTTKEN